MTDRTHMGVSGEAAWVTHGDTEYRVTHRERKAEYLPADYDVALVRGPDVLEHDYVRTCAHDAFLDAFGGR